MLQCITAQGKCKVLYPYLVLQCITAQGKGKVPFYPYLVLQCITAQGKGKVPFYPYLVLQCITAQGKGKQHKVHTFLQKFKFAEGVGSPGDVARNTVFDRKARELAKICDFYSGPCVQTLKPLPRKFRTYLELTRSKLENGKGWVLREAANFGRLFVNY